VSELYLNVPNSSEFLQALPYAPAKRAYVASRNCRLDDLEHREHAAGSHAQIVDSLLTGSFSGFAEPAVKVASAFVEGLEDETAPPGLEEEFETYQIAVHPFTCVTT